jgi:hypothetical protein
MTNYDEKPEVRITQAGDSSTAIAIIIAAIVVVVGAFAFFNNGLATTSDNPKVVQNNMALPTPVIEVPAKPEVVAPTTQPTTPSANAPAANL